jgi:phosphonate transport system ATP-binding protein
MLPLRAAASKARSSAEDDAGIGMPYRLVVDTVDFDDMAVTNGDQTVIKLQPEPQPQQEQPAMTSLPQTAQPPTAAPRAAPVALAAATTEALRTEALEVTYPNGVRALQRCSLSFAPGSFTVLLGTSGAGKSTLLRCLNGLVTPSAGRVVAAGIGDLSHKGALRAHRRGTGMVFQQHHLIGRQSVLANVLMGRLGYHGALATLRPWSHAEKELALQAIERVGLLDRALHRADQLSGGQQQRVGVARALVQRPRILLADEPVASLDPATADKLLSLMNGICRGDGLTAVVSLHQLELATRFADRIVGLKAGAIVFDGAPGELSPRLAAELYSSAPGTARPTAALPASPPFPHLQMSGVAL